MSVVGNEVAALMGRLVDLDRQAKSFAVDLSDTQPKSTEEILCVAFILCETQMLCVMSELYRVIDPPEQMTLIPGVRPWVQGVTNYHSRLLPLIDLQAFVCNSPVAKTDGEGRLLVAQMGEAQLGLKVTEVLGIRRVMAAHEAIRVDQDIRRVKDFVCGSYLSEGRALPVFSVAALLQHPEFKVMPERILL
jgi:twitching motility protein PilI